MSELTVLIAARDEAARIAATVTELRRQFPEARVEQSAIPVFRRHSLSTVDGVDSELGRLALVLLLGGATPGHYGVGPVRASSGLLPPIAPLLPTTTGA